jgi:heme O synthase-like polyprenyltransferase
MCSEQILVTAKKCKHCGEYLDGVRPQIAAASGLDNLAVQSQMKSVGVVALLAIFIPLLGTAYGSIKVCVVSIIAAIILFFIIGLSTQAKNSEIPALIFVSISIPYLFSIFWVISAASKYNRELIAAQNKRS